MSISNLWFTSFLLETGFCSRHIALQACSTVYNISNPIILAKVMTDQTSSSLNIKVIHHACQGLNTKLLGLY